MYNWLLNSCNNYRGLQLFCTFPQGDRERGILTFMWKIILIVMAAGISNAASQEPKLKPLFDGKSLKGWKQCNGQASYKVENKTITGATAEGSPNSFLCSEKEYGNFLLELEVNVDPELNSGVQIRSHQYKAATEVRTFNGKEVLTRTQPAGRVHGYQVEIASEKSGASGGVYDEAGRGWLDNISSKEPSRTAFKDNQWNKYRVRAEGDHIQVWINGVPCADLYDTQDASGFIALQVHAYKGPRRQVRFRNIQLAELAPTSWRAISDGKTMNGWETFGNGDWTLEDGAFHGSADPEKHKSGGYLLSRQSYGDFTLRYLYKIERGNSGLFFRFAHPAQKVEGPRGYEVEIDPTRDVGGLQEIGRRGWVQHVDAETHNAVYKKDQWNEMVISAYGHRLVISVNGQKIIDRNDIDGVLNGLLALQINARQKLDVWFKNLELLERVSK